MTGAVDVPSTAGELRVVLGRLVRRLRAEYRFSLSHGAVLGRLDREGPLSTSDLASAERVRQQSMGQTVSELEGDGLIERHPDPVDKRRALLELTTIGRQTLEAERRQREGWLIEAIAESFTEQERQTLAEAVPLLRRLADS